MPTLGVGEHRRTGCFLLLVKLITPERVVVVPTGNIPRLPFTAAVVKEDELRETVGREGRVRRRFSRR